MDRARFAEAIILQAMEDLFEGDECLESVKFFTGEEFQLCAEMAGMDHGRMLALLEVVSRVVGVVFKPGPRDLCVRDLPDPGSIPGVMGMC